MVDNEILLINKPKGLTSFGVIYELRRRLNIQKIGHAGTLDPLAEGLLILGIGKGTKKLSQFVDLPKTYVFEILFGTQTPTCDLESAPIKTEKITNLDQDKLKTILESFVGEVELEAPIFSAIKYKGKPLYKYARKNKEIPIPKRKSVIYKIKLIDVKKYQDGILAKIEAEVSSGTYVRSITSAISQKMKIVATTYSIARIKIGNFNLENAKNLDDL